MKPTINWHKLPYEEIPLGEALNSEDAIVEAVLLFDDFWNSFARRESDLWQVFSDWAEGQWWYAEQISDFYAVWGTFIRYVFGGPFMQKKIRQITSRLASPVPTKPEVEIDSSSIRPFDSDSEAIRLKPGITMEQWEAVCDEWDATVYPAAIKPETWRESAEFWKTTKEIKQKMADLQTGKTLCIASDCINYLPPRRRKYCSDKCANLHRPRRWRKQKPGLKRKSDKAWLDSLEPEDFKLYIAS